MRSSYIRGDIMADEDKKAEEVIADLEDKAGIIDADIGKFVSRKLLVWVVTTGLLFADKITGDQWISISLAYIGIQGVASIASAWKAAGK